MAKLAPYQWLYILLMVTATVVSDLGHLRDDCPGARQTACLPQHVDRAGTQRPGGWRADLCLHIAPRQGHARRTCAAYITLFTLVAFLLLRLPPIWKLVGGFQLGGGDAATTGGLAAFAGGLVVLTTLLWATPTHIGPDGANWVNVLRLPLLASGDLLAFRGAALVLGCKSPRTCDDRGRGQAGGPASRRPLRTCQRVRDTDPPSVG